MNKPHIEIYEGLSIDLSQLKCFRINTGYGEPWVIVEYKSISSLSCYTMSPIVWFKWKEPHNGMVGE